MAVSCLEPLRAHYAKDHQAAAALNRIVSSYIAFLNDQSKLPILTEAISGAPQELASVIPNPKRVLEQKQELADKIHSDTGTTAMRIAPFEREWAPIHPQRGGSSVRAFQPFAPAVTRVMSERYVFK